MQYGNVTARLKTASGGGVVTSFITRSGNGNDNDPNSTEDENDFEWVGGDLTHTQTNYFAFGNLSYLNGKIVSSPNTFTDFHNYMIQWEPTFVKWYIDGNVVRTLYKKDVGDFFPSRLSRVQFSIWDSNQGAQGTVQWAGGPTDWSNPTNPNYKLIIDSVDISCYYKGNTSWSFTQPMGSHTNANGGSLSGNTPPFSGSIGMNHPSTLSSNKWILITLVIGFFAIIVGKHMTL